MSTKTLRKRIALVAVAALGFGVLSTVSASATVSTARTLAVPGTPVLGGYVGAASTTTVDLTTTTSTTEAETITITPTIVSAPSGSALSVGAPAAGKVGLTSNNTTNTNGTAASNKWTNSSSSGVTTLAWSVTAGTIPAITSQGVATISLTADRQGKYVISLGVSSSTGTGTNTAATVTFYISDLYGVTADGLISGDTSNTSINGVAGVANSVVLQAVGGATDRLVTVSGAGATIASAGTAVTVATGGTSAVVAAGDGATTDRTLTILTPTAGTVTVSVFTQSQPTIYSTTARATVTITVASTASNGTVDSASSTATLSLTVGGTPVSNAYLDADVTTKAYAPRTTNTAAGKIVVSIAPVTAALSSSTSSTISVTGPGNVGFDMAQDGTGDDLGRAITRTTGTDGAFDVIFYGDGTSGTSTITITTGNFTKSFTVVFFGSVASYSVTAKNKYIAAGVTDAQVATVTALDSMGVAVPNATIYVTSSSSAVGTSALTITTGADGTAANLGVTGTGAGALSLALANAPTSATVTSTYDLAIVKAGIASVTLSFDKTEYTAGEKATITVTAKNADGALVGDNTYANFFTGSGITSSTNLAGNLPTASVATTSGVKTYTVYMPLAAGPVVISATLDASVAAAIQATAVTASTTVVSDGIAQAAADAAAEATDAANAATDAANAAAEAADAATAAAQDAADAVAALSTQVSEMINALKKQITALTNLVIKIQKKVRA